MFSTSDWTSLRDPNQPPCASAVLFALGERPNGPHDLEYVAAYSGLSLDAAAWVFGALEALHVLTRDERDDALYMPIPF